MTYTKEQQAANRDLWIAALESGEYEQGRTRLHYQDGDRHLFCCLGVACEVAKKNGLELDETFSQFRNSYGYGREECHCTLPYEVAEWLGIFNDLGEAIDHDDPEPVCRDLSYLNDYKAYNFKQIAQVIKEGKIKLIE